MQYFISQVLVCLCYIFLGLTYVTKKRNLILYFCLIALVFNGLHYSLLKAWAGVGVVIVAIIRNIIFLIQQKIKALDKYVIDDWIILIFLMIISVVFAVITYDTIFSLFTIAASILYTISVWQKNVKAYKIMGIIASMLSIVYFIYIWSIVGIILEILLCSTSIVFTIIYIKNEKKSKLEIKNNISTEEVV